ncbi:hypothetical protein CKM354_001171800 [Cercospora kikuchii]|uniref:N-acetyltransferase domain-containing protein n=1 Tax=Cercospora kikuchii TaxID=84275 RepID=A0A9P3CW03_9PEZI|nr:uncharacterized protein CKM354_001171800 [Cercospora kikuchii]GIZ48667.1 hypothetical protein CKM354_001171800 [Cercospora kikuchii]
MDEEQLTQPPIQVIWTERLQLKTITMEDLDDVMSFIVLPDVMKWTSVGAVATRAQGHKWLSARALGPEAYNFSVRERDLSSPDPEAVHPRVIGLFGSFHWPSCGYMLHPDFFGKGYATEGMRAFIPAYFERVPPASEGGTGHDLIDAYADTENRASMKVLEKLGFTKCETLFNEFEGPMGVRDSVVYRLARPGKTLDELGFGKTQAEDDGPPEPPVQ